MRLDRHVKPRFKGKSISMLAAESIETQKPSVYRRVGIASNLVDTSNIHVLAYVSRLATGYDRAAIFSASRHSRSVLSI
jgi:hypothetical protein